MWRLRPDTFLPASQLSRVVAFPRPSPEGAPFPWSSPTGCRLWPRWEWRPVPPSIGPGRAGPPQPAPKRHRPAIFGNTTTPCPTVAGHGAPSATVCRLAIRTGCRLPPPAGPRCAGVPWSMPGATRAPNASIGNPSNRWDMFSNPYPYLRAYPSTSTKLFPNHLTIFLTHPLSITTTVGMIV